MTTDTRKAGIGALLLLASTAVLLSTGTMGTTVPTLLGAVGAVGLAVGALLVGLSEEGATV